MHFSLLFVGFYYKNSAFPRGLSITVAQKISACGGLSDKSPLNDTGVPPVPGGSPVIFRFWQSPLSPPRNSRIPPGTEGSFGGEFLPPEGFGVRGEFPPTFENPPVPGGNIHPYSALSGHPKIGLRRVINNNPPVPSSRPTSAPDHQCPQNRSNTTSALRGH